MKTKERLAVVLLFGGQSNEHEVSLTSAASVIKAIDAEKFEVVPVLITREGGWYLVKDTRFLVENQARLLQEKDYSSQSFMPVILDYTKEQRLIALEHPQDWKKKVDVVFPILHGQYGEDGTVQGLCKLAHLPCVGAGILGSATGMDKVAMKQLFTACGLNVCFYWHFRRSDWEKAPDDVVRQIMQKFQFPMFVKPANSGSSVGVNKAKNMDDLKKSIQSAARFDSKIIIEKAVNARECECAILGNEEPQASVVGEILPCHEFYDYEAKYLGDSKTLIPANIPDHVAKTIRNMAIKAFQAVDCYGFARVDFFVEKDTLEVYVNEINTIPGFTPISMYPKLWEACGIPYSSLVTRLIELAVQKFQSEACDLKP